MITLSKGNKKVKNTLIFNIAPITTCIGDCKGKEGKCYAMKASRRFPNVRNCYNRNTEVAKSEGFKELMIASIQYHVMNFSFKYFRIHEAGDFFNQRYLNDWCDIASKFPNIKFLAYTKSFQLNFDNVPSNLTIINSIWGNENQYTKFANKGFKTSVVVNDLNDIKFNSNKDFVCPADDCSTCRKCWGTDKNIIFKLH